MPNPRPQIFSPRSFARSFIVLDSTFRPMVHFKLILAIWCKVRIHFFFFFAHENPVEKAILSPFTDLKYYFDAI